MSGGVPSSLALTSYFLPNVPHVPRKQAAASSSPSHLCKSVNIFDALWTHSWKRSEFCCFCRFLDITILRVNAPGCCTGKYECLLASMH
eukprot:6176897-Pleurochrysis_carterae.AAC.3